ncbi:MAG: DUF2142 domain-containing protein [Anaerolineae bacterium]|nr:DUF2142 domain-containing protein [Anaerolineae bacterium]
MRDRLPRQPRLLYAILALALAHGLLYLALIPPWQHYDEPSHFEYVRLIAERGELPRIGDYDLAMRREIAASMLAFDFWKGSEAPAFDLQSGPPPDIGISQMYHPPLYYLLLAGPQLLVARSSVETQLYLARLCSVFLSLVVVASAYGLVAELFPSRRWLPAAVAGFIALLPPFTDLMSSVNNDTGAAAAASLLLWASIRLLRRGATWRRVAVILVLAAVCLAVKNTSGVIAITVLGILPAAWLWPLRPSWLWRGLALLMLLIALVTCTWGGQAAYWQSHKSAAAFNRLTTDALLGRSTLVLSSRDRRFPLAVIQELERSVGRNLHGHTITIGAWLRAAQETESAVQFCLRDKSSQQWFTVQATPEWEFHAITANVALDARSVGLYIALAAEEQTVYLDGLVLIDGEAPPDLAPTFDTERAEAGWWGALRFTNLLRNGSAEEVWPGLRPWIGNREVFRESMATLFHSVWDWRRTGWVYWPEIQLLFQSFWGRFGWNHLALPEAYFYPLALATVAGGLGAGIGLVRRARKGHLADLWQRQAMAVLLAAALASWGAALLRIHPVFLTARIDWPVARYATTAIIPTALLLCGGWAEFVPRRLAAPAAWLGLLLLALLDLAALLVVIVPYYYG